MLAAVKLTSATRQNLWRLTFIRTLVLAAQAGSVRLAYWFDLLPLPWLQLECDPGFLHRALCVYRDPVAHHLAGDRAGIRPATGLRPVYPQCVAVFLRRFHQSVCFVLPGALTIAAVTLPWRYSVVLSGIALTLYTLLLARFYPLQTFPIARENLQIYGMWLSFALSAAVITFFAARMAEELRRQEELRAIRREEGLRDQQLLAVAAGCRRRP